MWYGQYRSGSNIKIQNDQENITQKKIEMFIHNTYRINKIYLNKVMDNGFKW